MLVHTSCYPTKFNHPVVAPTCRTPWDETPGRGHICAGFHVCWIKEGGGGCYTTFVCLYVSFLKAIFKIVLYFYDAEEGRL